MRPARIVILSSGPLCRNPRVHKEAFTLAQAGYEVTVVTVAHHARFEAYDAEILRNAPFRKVVLDRLSTRPSVKIVSIGERILSLALRRAKIQHPAALGPYHALRRLALAQPFDLLIAHTELPLCIAADLLAKKHPVAADIEDWHSQDLLPAARAQRPINLLVRTETLLLQKACYTSTTSHAMATGLAAACDSPVPVVVPNTFTLSSAPSPGLRATPPAIFWFSQSIGPGRGLEEFFAAWSLTTAPSRVVLLGDISAGYDTRLLASLPASHRSRLTFHPIVAPAELPALIGRHHLGLALEPNAPANKNLTISNKIFHYLDAGLAVLATPTAGQREVFDRDPAIGLIDDMSSPAALAGKLDELLTNPDRLAAMGASARRLAQSHFCWEKSSPILLAAVAGALHRPRAPA